MDTFKRKIYSQLREWKERAGGRRALMIQGARRVGKSTIAEEFAKKEYLSYILIDFGQAPKRVVDLFEDLSDLNFIFLQLQMIYKVKLVERKSVIVFDEVQLAPKARQAIKYLVADGRYDYIETGSLIGIRKFTEGILIPSEETTIEMYPMDFEEFLWAMGDEMMMPFIKMQFEKRKPMEAFHRKALDYFRQYMIVGGMPQAVQTYVDTRDFDKVDERKRDILGIYRNDIRKYADNQETKVAAIFEELPGQLQKHEKKFRLADLQSHARMRDYSEAFFWLSDAKIINCCYNSTEPSIGLKLNEERTTLKCYMGDTGLLICHAFDERGIVTSELYQKLMFDKLEVNEGMLVENIVAQMLRAAGHKLYFFSKYSAKEADERMEIDFLIAKPTITSRHNISPIEVKSGSNYTITSLKKCIKKYGKQLATPYVLHDKDLKVEDGITYLPLYMTPLL